MASFLTRPRKLLLLFIDIILDVVIFAEKLKYANRIINLTAQEIVDELKAYCDIVGVEKM